MDKRLNLERKLRRRRNINKAYDSAVSVVLIILLIFAGYALYQHWQIAHRGMGTLEYHNFDELRKINPDVVAWLKMDNTHIDHPVVQGKDNFEYLDKDFYGKYYEGGTLFLDCKNKKDFSDSYNLIHGHHMAYGAMFGDLDKYKKKDFFEKNKTGTLFTPKCDYSLTVIGVATVSEYDKIFSVGDRKRAVLAEGERICSLKRKVEIRKTDMILGLATCTDKMDDNRTIVICRARKK